MRSIIGLMERRAWCPMEPTKPPWIRHPQKVLRLRQGNVMIGEYAHGSSVIKDSDMMASNIS